MRDVFADKTSKSSCNMKITNLLFPAWPAWRTPRPKIMSFSVGCTKLPGSEFCGLLLPAANPLPTAGASLLCSCPFCDDGSIVSKLLVHSFPWKRCDLSGGGKCLPGSLFWWWLSSIIWCLLCLMCRGFKSTSSRGVMEWHIGCDWLWGGHEHRDHFCCLKVG